MMQRNYYYLISGLPEIVLEQSKAPFSLSELVEQLREAMHPSDFQYIELILLRWDNQNLLRWLQQDEVNWATPSNFARETLEAELREPERIPPYFAKFAEAYKNNEPIWAGMSWENQLTRLYYDYALAKTEGFLHQWFDFERNLRNILAGWNSRQYEVQLGGQLIGQNEITHAIEHNHSRDFGLAREVEFMDKLEQALERDELLEREQAIDYIQWNFIAQANVFHYFSTEVLLGYFLRFILLDHWLRLSAERGQENIEQYLQKMEDKYKNLVTT